MIKNTGDKMYKVRIDNCDLQQIAKSGQCFRWEKTDDDSYNIISLNDSVLVRQDCNDFYFSCDEKEYNDKWKGYLDAETDYSKMISDIEENDSFLVDAALYGSGIRILKQDFWEMMITFIISQNNNIPRITKSLKLLCDKFGVFPDYEVLRQCTSDDLQGLGLGYRDKYLISAAEYYDKNKEEKLRNMTYDEAMKDLMSVNGIGKKVANCICLFGLHMLQACPIDTWMKKLIDEDYGGIMPAWMNCNVAGVYQQYVFYYKRNN